VCDGPTGLYGVTSQKIAYFTVTAVVISDSTKFPLFISSIFFSAVDINLAVN
jgi:hypothetical protein